MFFRIKLNADQEEIVSFAAKGHNLLITGQAGVGKSEVVKRIIANRVVTQFNQYAIYALI